MRSTRQHIRSMGKMVPEADVSTKSVNQGPPRRESAIKNQIIHKQQDFDSLSLTGYPSPQGNVLPGYPSDSRREVVERDVVFPIGK